ncbi:MAG: VIT and vWA domain-containing protein [Armatimonadota bacterium]
MWSPRFRLWFRPDAPASDPGPVNSIPEETAALIRDAFPREAASEALRGRVAERCRSALEAGSPARPARRPTRLHYALAACLLLLLILPLLSPRGGGVAYAEAATTPGQLTVLDDTGRAAGVCPLKHTDVKADVTGYLARVSVTQQFENRERQPVEAVYTFPLPADAAVDRMTLTIGDRVIEGEIRRREEARQLYDAAKEAGQAAALLDQERPNIFTQSVANLMPGQPVTVTISYVQTLKYEDGQYELVYPMVVGPRFTAGSGGYQAPGLRGEPSSIRQFQGDPGKQSVVTDAEKITPPITPEDTRAGHDISVTVNVDAGLPIQALQSELHDVDVERRGEGRATVALRGGKTIPNKDFILRYGVAGDDVKAAVLAHATEKGSGYFTLLVQPPKLDAAEAPAAQPREIIFVIDQSGSQSGWPIAKAKETMRYLIRTMNPDDTFQLLGFSMEVEPCFEKPVPNTPENVAKALRFLEPLEGNGGTDVLNAVDYALTIPSSGRRRLVCYLTDGYVGNDMQVLGYVRKHRGEAQMFPFGMGNGTNRFLIDGMAKEGHGVAEYVTLKSSAEEAAARFYRRVAEPLVTDLTLDWGGLKVADLLPERIPDLFVGGRPIVLKGLYLAPGEGTLTLRGALDGKPWSYEVPVRFPEETGGDPSIATLWAREKIEELQGQDWSGAQFGTPNPQIKEQIVNLALEFRLMSQYTSFVAVEQRVVNVGGKQRTIDVPVEMPDGVSYDGIFGEDAEQQVAFADGRAKRVGHWYSAPATPPAAGGQMAPGFLPPGGAVAAMPASEAPLQRRNGDAYGDGGVVPEVGVTPFQETPEMTAVPIPGKSKSRVIARRPRSLQVQESGSPTGFTDIPFGRGEVKPAKLHATLRQRLTQATPGEEVEVQLWVRKLPADWKAQLEKLGFELATELTPGKLLLGSVPVKALEKLAELEWVVRVEPPRFR